MKLLNSDELKNINGGCIWFVFKYYRQIASFFYNLLM